MVTIVFLVITADFLYTALSIIKNVPPSFADGLIKKCSYLPPHITFPCVEAINKQSPSVIGQDRRLPKFRSHIIAGCEKTSVCGLGWVGENADTRVFHASIAGPQDTSLSLLCQVSR